MSNELIKINKNYYRIVACLGDRHIPGKPEMLKKRNIEFETIRLKELLTN